MGLVCLDEALEPMTVDEWRTAHRARGHVPVIHNSGENWCIKTFWVGICTGSEDPKRPYLVEFYRPGADGYEDSRLYWCTSLAAATDRHNKCLLDIHQNKPKVLYGKRPPR